MWRTSAERELGEVEVPGGRDQQREERQTSAPRALRIGGRFSRPDDEIGVVTQEGRNLLRTSSPRYQFVLLAGAVMMKWEGWNRVEHERRITG